MGVITAKIFDLATNELADISPICFEPTLTRRMSQARQMVIQSIAGHSLLTTVAGDGYRNLRKGNRKLIVWEDDTVIFHGRIFNVERNGDGSSNKVAITAFDPFMELGYDADDRAGRPVRDNTGNFSDPSFAGTGTGGPDVISGPDLIQQILTNSVNADPTLGEGALPIDFASGTFDIDSPPAVDMTCELLMNWPILVGDFIQMLVQTGVVDVDMRPVDPSEGFDPYIMVALSAVSSQGTDKSGTVHFDYWTGSFNAAACRHVEDFQTINNKLFDYLGPRIDKEHWPTNIAPDVAGVDPGIDFAGSRALYGGPDSGQFMSIREFDGVFDPTAGPPWPTPPIFMALYNGELGFRVEPRDMLFITPAPDTAGLFTAPQDFDVGDLIAVNTGGEFGLELAETQRVYGYSKTWDRQGVARLSELITSADG